MTEEGSYFFDVAVEVFYDALAGDRHLFLLSAPGEFSCANVVPHLCKTIHIDPPEVFRLLRCCATPEHLAKSFVGPVGEIHLEQEYVG